MVRKYNFTNKQINVIVQDQIDLEGQWFDISRKQQHIIEQKNLTAEKKTHTYAYFNCEESLSGLQL